MRKLAELRQRLDALKADGEAILNAADDEDRNLSDEETAKFDRIEADITKVRAEIAAEEQMDERRRSLASIRTAAPAGDRITNEPDPDTTAGFKGIGEFAASVREACIPGNVADERLRRMRGAVANTHQGGDAEGSGYLVPSEFRDAVWEVVTETDDLLGLVDVEPTNARQVEGLADETTPWGSAGIQARWRTENSQMTADKVAQEPRKTPLHELYVFALASEELLSDAPRLANRITRKAGLALSWKISDSIVYGTGAGQPLGWFNSTALVSVAKESGQAADTITAANVLKMYSRLLRIPGDTPFWLANSDIVPQLAQMTIGDQPVWMPPNGLIAAPGGILMGLPVRFSEHAKTLGDKGDLQLVSGQGYYAARRTGGPEFASSMHLYFDYALEAFRWMFRFGGQPHLSGPVSPANGSATKSHFVTLDERA